MESECPSVAASSGLVGFSNQVVYGGVNWQPKESFGVGPSYLTVHSWQISRGGFFGEREIRSAEKVCVIGQTLVANLFQTIDPVERRFGLGAFPFASSACWRPRAAAVWQPGRHDPGAPHHAATAPLLGVSLSRRDGRRIHRRQSGQQGLDDQGHHRDPGRAARASPRQSICPRFHRAEPARDAQRRSRR